MINNSINVTAFEAFASSRQSAEDYDVIERKIELFKMKDVRIILLGVKAVSLKYIFCEAYKQNMIGPRYFWIVLFEDMFSDWFSSKNVNCTSEQLLVASNGFMYVSFAALRRDGEVTIANKTADEVWQLVKDQVNSLYSVPPSTISYNVLSMYAYDGLWALAKLLDTAEKTLKTFNIDLLLERNATLVMQLTDLMEKIKFQGVSGQYSYLGKNSRDRIGDVLFMQFIPNGTYTEVGYLNSELDEIYFNTTKQSLLMPGFFFPKDGPVVREIPMIFSLQVLIVIWSFVAAGIILSLSFLSANIKYRKVGLIKLSSPNINNAIIVGCMLCYVSVALYGIDSRIVKAGNIPSTCNAVIIILSTGFTLSFGGLFSKTWRIYKIFIKSRSLSSNGIRDLHLFGVLLVLLLIDSVVFTVWMTVSPFKLHFDFMDSVINDVDDTVVKPVIYRCRCKYQNQFSVALYAYKGVLLIFGLFVAWETRNIKITVINDSRYIGMAVYNVAVLSTIGAISTAAIQGTPYFQIGYLTFSICIIVCTTLTLLVIFAPKIRMLSNGFEDPHFKNGRPIISSHSSMQGRKMSTQATSLKLHTITENWSNPMMLESTDTASSTMNSLTNTCGSYNNTAYET